MPLDCSDRMFCFIVIGMCSGVVLIVTLLPVFNLMKTILIDILIGSLGLGTFAYFLKPEHKIWQIGSIDRRTD